MSIATIVTRGYGSFGTIGDITRAGYDAAGGAGVVVTPPAVVTLVGGAIPSWQDFVTAEFRKNHLEKAVAKEEKKLDKIEKQIAKAFKQVKASEHPEGILANIFRLEAKRDELENKIHLMKVEIIPIDAFLQAEIDDDDEEILLL